MWLLTQDSLLWSMCVQQWRCERRMCSHALVLPAKSIQNQWAPTHYRGRKICCLLHSQLMGRRWRVGGRAGIQHTGVSCRGVCWEKGEERRLACGSWCVQWERGEHAGQGGLVGETEAAGRPEQGKGCEELKQGEQSWQNVSARHWRWHEGEMRLGQMVWQHFNRPAVVSCCLCSAPDSAGLSGALWLIHQQTQLLQPGLPPWHWERRVGCPHFQGFDSSSNSWWGWYLFSKLCPAGHSSVFIGPALCTDGILLVWNGFWLFMGFVFSSLEDLLQTISPNTATNENFHSNLKTLMGRNQAQYFMIFVFFSRSSILLFLTGNWEGMPLSMTVTMCRKPFLHRESTGTPGTQQWRRVTGNTSFYEWLSSYFYKLPSQLFLWLLWETYSRQYKNWTFQFENTVKVHPAPKWKCWFGFQLLPGNLNAEHLTILSHSENSLGKTSPFSISSTFWASHVTKTSADSLFHGRSQLEGFS